MPADQSDAGLVAGRLDAQHQRGRHHAQHLPHDHGVDAGRLVVAAPDPDLGEAVPQVQLPRPGIVLPHLEQDLRAAAAARLGDERGQQRRAGPLAPATRIHGHRHHVGLRPAGEHHPGVPDQRVSLLGHQVEAARGRLCELRREHLRVHASSGKSSRSSAMIPAGMSAWPSRAAASLGLGGHGPARGSEGSPLPQAAGRDPLGRSRLPGVRPPQVQRLGRRQQRRPGPGASGPEPADPEPADPEPADPEPAEAEPASEAATSWHSVPRFGIGGPDHLAERLRVQQPAGPGHRPGSAAPGIELAGPTAGPVRRRPAWSYRAQ